MSGRSIDRIECPQETGAVNLRSAAGFSDVYRALMKGGVLLQSDSKLPSVVTLVAGEPVKGSWWSHPLGDAIHVTNKRLAEHEDVVVTYLISRKVTYVHRRLWPALLAVALSDEPWQSSGLSRIVSQLLSTVNRAGRVRTDRCRILQTVTPGQRRSAIRALEQRVLVHSTDTHTERGTHVKTLERWSAWRRRKGLEGASSSAADGRAVFEDLRAAWEAEFSTPVIFPWKGHGPS